MSSWNADNLSQTSPVHFFCPHDSILLHRHPIALRQNHLKSSTDSSTLRAVNCPTPPPPPLPRTHPHASGKMSCASLVARERTSASSSRLAMPRSRCCMRCSRASSGGEGQQCQYLYFCTSKARKPSTCDELLLAGRCCSAQQLERR